MKVLEYLQRKYGVERPTTLLSSEAKIFGIPMPLKAGWLDKYSHIEITEGMIYRLRISLEAKSKNGQKMAPIGLQVIANMEGKQDPVQPFAKQVKKLKAKKEKKQKKLWSDEFLQSYEWRRVRMMALKKYGAKCQCCGATPQTGAIMNVDHIKPRKLFPHLALDVDNLQVLCHECNHGKGNWDMTDWRTKVLESKSDFVE